jgi:hypothetical protein
MSARPEVTGKKTAPFSIAERFQFGSFSIAECKALAGVSHNKIYTDIKNGLLFTHKRGAATFVRGPDLAKYLALDIDAAE